MVQLLRRNDSTLYQTVHTQAGFHVLAHISHMDDWVTHGKLEIFAYVRVQTHDTHVLDSLIFLHFIVETNGLRPAPIQETNDRSLWTVGGPLDKDSFIR